MKKLIDLGKGLQYRLGALSLGTVVLAADDPSSIDITPKHDFASLGNFQLPEIVPVIIQIILIVAALIALIFLIIGGIKWITSGGDKAAVEAARGTITSALIGLLVVFAAWAIIRLLSWLFGIDVLNFTIPQITGSGSSTPIPTP